MPAEIQHLLTLGVGGIIAGIVLFWKRIDDKAYADSLKANAAQFAELSARMFTVVDANTRAMTEIASVVRQMGELRELGKHLSELRLILAAQGADVMEEHG